MDQIANVTRLHRRGNRYYHRVRVPRHLREANPGRWRHLFGKSGPYAGPWHERVAQDGGITLKLWKSLEIGDHRTAKRLLNRKAAEEDGRTACEDGESAPRTVR